MPSGGLTEDLAFIYDGLGRVSQRKSTVTPTTGDAVEYTQAIALYDADGLPLTLNYSACQLGVCASAASIDTIYDALGRATTLAFSGFI